MSVETVIIQLSMIKQRIQDSHGNSAAFNKHMQELWGVVSSITDKELVQKITEHNAFSELSDFFKPHWSQYLLQQELAYCDKIRDSNADIPSLLGDAEHYYPPETEFILLPDIISGCFTMAGCGPYPETLINACIMEYGFSSFTGLDASQKCIDVAAMAFAKATEQRDALFIATEASAYDFSGVFVILLANGLRQKDKVLQQAANTAPHGALILVRIPVLLGSLLYETITDAQAHACGLTKIAQVSASPLSLTLSYVKN